VRLIAQYPDKEAGRDCFELVQDVIVSRKWRDGKKMEVEQAVASCPGMAEDRD
jgi:hypothetical protein